MGIAPYLAEAIIRECKYRPMRGDVLLLGRQTMLFTPEHAMAMFREGGVEPVALPAGEDIIDRRTDLARGREWIRDDAFFRMLGADRVRAVDYSSYEGAEIVHDLNRTVPADLEGSADFIVDGSTLDNVFDPATCLQSVARMLRPGGRFIANNVGSPHQNPYMIMTPYWLLDFFSVNAFADCRVYVMLHGRRGERNVFAVDAASESGPSFTAPRQITLVAFAEKGPESTWNRYPVQRFYADAAAHAQYRAAAARFAASGRPEILVSWRPLPMRLSLVHGAVEHYRMMRAIAGKFPMVDAEGRKRPVELPRAMEIGRRFTQYLRID